MILAGIRNLRRGAASAGWPTTEGLIVASSVEEHGHLKTDGRSPTFHAKVAYEYKLGGQRYESSQLSYKSYGTSKAARAKRIVEKYPVGTEVTIYYNPMKPDQAVLEPGANIFTALPLIFGVSLVVLALLGMFGVLTGNGS